MNKTAARLSLLCLAALTALSACGQPASVTPDGSEGQTSVAVTDSPPTFVPGEKNEVILLSIEEYGDAHLFLYSPETGQPLTRLTDGHWDDITPAVNPDGSLLAFASNRGGVWDLYLLDLESGQGRKLTDTPEFDSSPSWSPDGQWLAFETYNGNDMEIAVVSLTDDKVIVLTEDPASDHSPVWSPQGRQIAFVSNRSGNPDIWLADLDRTDAGRFVNLSHTANAAESHPQWNSDGSQLVWTTDSQSMGFSGAYLWETESAGHPARWLADADWAAFSPEDDRFAVVIGGPNQSYLSALRADGGLLLPPVLLPGPVRGLAWAVLELPDPLPASFQKAAELTPTAPWSLSVRPLVEGPTQRWTVIPLADVQAPYPALHDLVDESFNALRRRTADDLGWDPMASLENAFVPLTTSLDPSLGNDWLLTGRAFALNSVIANAGWMVAVREEIGQQTYWRVYLRAQSQDGTQGEPLRDAPWNLSARYELDPSTYDAGGQYAPVPTGYWIDFTSLALAYGWERLPALPNWRSYYAGARFTEFALTGGMDWYSAMLELYPPSALVTPTLRLPPTITPTRTPPPTRTPTATFTPRATLTPSNTPTPIPSPTPIPTNTPLP